MANITRTSYGAVSRSPSIAVELKQAGLHELYITLSETVLRFQSPTTGLFPLWTDGNCSVGDVRSSIYCALATWSLHLAYKRVHCEDHGRTHLLGQTAVKTMRGVLKSWMYQIPKMKKFLDNQTPKNSLHIRFDIVTGQVLGDTVDYPHLQLDCIGLFILSLVQMISSGLQIVYTSDEVDFIQNLIYCIERAYRIADFGMWGRGSKYNNGTPELNASTVGIAKAAMESANGFNLFGEHGAAGSVVYADVDAHMRNKIVFEVLVPRESKSKTTDAALLPVLTWPTFAVHDTKVKEHTLSTIMDRLKGGCGFKRFLRDGYGTVLEDKNRRHYGPSEIKMFEGIECQWPFLSFFLVIDSMFEGKCDKAMEYYNEIKPYLKMSRYGVVVPQYYYVPRERVNDRHWAAHQMVATEEGDDDKYFLWGQSVYIVMRLLVDKLLPVNDLDPIKRHLSASERPRFSHRYTMFEASAKDRLIQVAVIAESVNLQQVLATHGIISQTPTQVQPIRVWSPNQLKKALQFMGVNNKLDLTGRPGRPVGLLGTSMFYRVCGQTIISYPLLFEVNDFYISQDLNSVIHQVQANLEALSRLWKLSGRPTYIVMVTEAMVQAPNAKYLIDLLSSFKSGLTTNNVRVKQDRLQSMVSTGTKEHLDFLTQFHEERAHQGELAFEFVQETVNGLPTEVKVNLSTKTISRPVGVIKDLSQCADWKLMEQFRATDDVHEQSQALKYLADRYGLQHLVDNQPISDHLERIRRNASQSCSPDWSVVRLCSALTKKVTDSLAPSITNMLVRGKLVTLGVFGHEELVISEPKTPTHISEQLYRLCQPIEPRESVLQQEMILLLGHINNSRPQLFDGILKIRVGWILHVMQYALTYEGGKQSIFSLSPNEISDLLMKVLNNVEHDIKRPAAWTRRLLGSLGCVPSHFWDNIWYILERTPKGIQLYDYHLPQEPTLSDLTVEELNFALRVEEMLSVISDPLHRHVIVEVLTVVAVVLGRNPEVSFCEPVNVKGILDLALDFFRTVGGGKHTSYEELRDTFFMTPTYGINGTYSFIAKAVCTMLLENGLDTDSPHECNVA